MHVFERDVALTAGAEVLTSGTAAVISGSAAVISGADVGDDLHNTTHIACRALHCKRSGKQDETQLLDHSACMHAAS